MSKYPSFERAPGKSDNWVEKAGGLPAYIDKIARTLHYERGMSIGRAIATAVERCQLWAAGGGDVKPDTRAKAAAALAAWEAKKKRGKLDLAADVAAVLDLSDADVDHDSTMVALMVPAVTARKIPRSDLPPDDLHVTLAYVGGTSPEQAQMIAAAVRRVAQSFGPLYGKIGGLGHFPDNGDGAPYYAPVDVPGLEELRERIVSAVDRVPGVSVRRDHGFTPHMTLKYVKRGEKAPEAVPETPVSFTQVTVARGGRTGNRIHAKLGDNIAMSSHFDVRDMIDLSETLEHDDDVVMIDLAALEDDDAALLIDLAPGDYRPPYDWKHGYVPITPAAALSKAKGDRKRAAKLLTRGGNVSPADAAKKLAGMPGTKSRKRVAGERRKPTVTEPMKPAATPEDDAAARGRGTPRNPYARSNSRPPATTRKPSTPVAGPSNAEKIANAEKMHGTGSKQHKAAQERFGGKTRDQAVADSLTSAANDRQRARTGFLSGDRVNTEFGPGTVAMSSDRSTSVQLDNGDRINVQKGTPGHDRIKAAGARSQDTEPSAVAKDMLEDPRVSREARDAVRRMRDNGELGNAAVWFRTAGNAYPDGSPEQRRYHGAADRLQARGNADVRREQARRDEEAHEPAAQVAMRAQAGEPGTRKPDEWGDNGPKKPADMTPAEIVAEQDRLGNYIRGRAGGTASSEDVDRWQTRRRELETERQKRVRDAMRSHPDRQGGNDAERMMQRRQDDAKREAKGKADTAATRKRWEDADREQLNSLPWSRSSSRGGAPAVSFSPKNEQALSDLEARGLIRMDRRGTSMNADDQYVLTDKGKSLVGDTDLHTQTQDRARADMAARPTPAERAAAKRAIEKRGGIASDEAVEAVARGLAARRKAAESPKGEAGEQPAAPQHSTKRAGDRDEATVFDERPEVLEAFGGEKSLFSEENRPTKIDPNSSEAKRNPGPRRISAAERRKWDADRDADTRRMFSQPFEAYKAEHDQMVADGRAGKITDAEVREFYDTRRQQLGLTDAPESDLERRNRRNQAARGTLEPTAADLTWAADEWKRRNPDKKLAGHEDEVNRLARTRAQDKTDRGLPRTSDAERASERARAQQAAGEVQRTAQRLSDEKNAGTSSTNPDASIRVEHSRDGTLVHGTERGDTDTITALKGQGFKWSRNLNAWYLPRNQRPETREQKVRALEAKLGDKLGVDRDNAPARSAAERDAETRARAAARAERMDARAERKAGEAESRFKASDDATAGIPFGQPILVGHHSQRRHERALEKARAQGFKGLEATREAERAQAAADRARRTAEGTESKVTIGNRIERNERELRDINRRLDGTSSSVSGPAQGEYKERLESMKAELEDRIGFDKGKLEAAGGLTASKDTVNKGDFVKIRGRWYPVTRANAKTVSVPNAMIPSRSETTPWREVQEHRKAGEVTRADVARMVQETSIAFPELRAELAKRAPAKDPDVSSSRGDSDASGTGSGAGARGDRAGTADTGRTPATSAGPAAGETPAAAGSGASRDEPRNAQPGPAISEASARRMSDEQLETALGRLFEAGATDTASLQVLEAELDRRDRAKAGDSPKGEAAAPAADPALDDLPARESVFTPDVIARMTPQQLERSLGTLLGNGWDNGSRAVSGMIDELERKAGKRAAAPWRKGSDPDVLARDERRARRQEQGTRAEQKDAYRDWVEQQAIRMESEVSHGISRRGKARGSQNSRSSFNSGASTIDLYTMTPAQIRANASQEALEYFARPGNEPLPFDAWRAQVLGHTDRRAVESLRRRREQYLSEFG